MSYYNETALLFKARYEENHPDGEHLRAVREAKREHQRTNPERVTPARPTPGDWDASFRLCEDWPGVTLRYTCDDSAVLCSEGPDKLNLRAHRAYLRGRKKTRAQLIHLLKKYTYENEYD